MGTLGGRGRSFAFGAIVMAIGCGSSDAPRKPDTGSGAGLAPPATMNCTDFCQRVSDCAAILCDEDSMSMKYAVLGDVLAPQCEAMCTDSLLQMKFTTSQWQCIFESSCRQVIDSSYDVCHEMSSYSCH